MGTESFERKAMSGSSDTDLTLTFLLIYVVPGDPKGSCGEAPPSGAKEGGVLDEYPLKSALHG